MTQNVTLLLYIVIHILWSFAVVCWSNNTDVPWGMYIMLQQWNVKALHSLKRFMVFCVWNGFFLTVLEIDKNFHFLIATKCRCVRVKGSNWFPKVVRAIEDQSALITGNNCWPPFLSVQKAANSSDWKLFYL